MAFVLIAAFNPSAGAAWTNFQASIQGFPAFNNPFNQASSTLLSYDFIPVRPTQAAPGATSSNFTGCFGSEGWTCVQDLNGTDNERSYISLPNPAVDTSNAIWTGLSPSVKGRVISVQYDLWCRYSGPTNIGAYLIPTLWKWDGAVNALIEGNVFEVSACGNGFFSHVTAKSDTCNHGTGGCGEVDAALYNTPFSLQVASQAPFSMTPWHIHVSTLRVTILIGVVNADATVTCGGDILSGLSCHFRQLIDFVSKLGSFVVNGVIYIFQILGYLVNIVVQFFSLFGYFFTVPGMPSILQSLLTVLFVGLMLFVSIVIMGKVRGTGNTG